MDDKDKQNPEDTETNSNRPLKHAAMWRSIALVFFCFVAAALGAIVVLIAQDDLRQTITSNTREIVSREGELITNIADELGPSTVAITTQSVGAGSFFSGPTLQEGAGTGIVISEDGYVMTNRHVIPEDVREVTVTLADDRQFDNVRVVGRDPVNDIAFLKIQGVNGLDTAPIGNSSEMEVGQKVIAISNALGQFRNTVTTGVLSGVGRPIVAQNGGEVQRLENLFQTDAAINPGNSGGPLVNLNGEVIGINTAVVQGAEGIGFAIPIDDVKGLIDSVTDQGELVRPYIGVRSVTLTPELAEQLDIEVESGAYVVENGVINGSPAAQAGVRAGDIIVEVEGEEINEDNVLGSAVVQYGVGETITLTVLRGGEERQLELTLEEFPESR